MTKTAVTSTIEVGVETSEPAQASTEAPGKWLSPETEADKIRRQMHLRRKIKLARRALAAHRR